MSNSIVQGLASIIVPCWNQLEFTRQCIAALKRYTRPEWELIVIDNGSTDQTGIYLAGVQDGAAVPVTLISNSTNLGFPAAINQGLREARGEYLVLLNNDVVVTDGWLDQLTALANTKNGFSEDWCGWGERRPPVSSGAVSGQPRPTHIEFIELDANGNELAVGGNGSDSASGARVLRPTLSTIGLVGPMSNYATPPQLVEGVTYRDMAEMHAYARRWRDDHRGQWLTVPKLSGFCLLMKRALYDKIGGLDERFGLGFFDDDDLAERARLAGYELAVAHDLFVHHFGSRTFAGNGVDAEQLLDENARRFASKWGLNGSHGTRVSLRPWRGAIDSHANGVPGHDAQSEAGAERGGTGSAISPIVGQVFQPDALLPASQLSDVRQESLTYGERARVSLTMIVKDEEKNLGACLESVRGIFDEIVIVDTGSTDRTIEIARSFGANVFEFAWVDSFSAARNEALSHATGDYAFWLDADDVVEPDQREKLLAIRENLRVDDSAAFVVRCKCDPSPDGSGGETVVDHMRLFPLRGDIRWTYRVHEQILPAVMRAKVPVRWTDLVIRHTGYADPALRDRKLDRDLRLLNLELVDRPEDPFILFNLGSIGIERCQWHEALAFLRRSLAGSAPTDSIVRKLFALIAKAHQMLGESQAALAACAAGLKLDPEDAELWFRKAYVHRHRGESAEAEQSWRRVLGLRRPDRYCSVDQGIFGHLTRRNLAVLAAERGDHPEAARLWGAVLDECPNDREAMARLGVVLTQ